MCHMSRVTCHMSPVTFLQKKIYIYIFLNVLKKFDKGVELVGGGSVINRA